MKCYEIIEKLETHSPSSYAESWDNIGLLAGRRDKEVKTIYIALDATDDVIEEAVRLKADFLLTHHPLIFHKLSRVNTDDFIGRSSRSTTRLAPTWTAPSTPSATPE